MEDQGIVFIPARFHSSRFPGKPLALIHQKPMIEHVFCSCQKSGLPTYVVTDDERIEKTVKGFGGKVVRVEDEVLTGTDRVYKAYQKLGAGAPLIVNVQGDEPLLRGSDIVDLIELHREHDFDLTTLVQEREGNEAEFNDPNIVKVAYNRETAKCHYFSRAPVPHGEKKKWYHHVGVYCFSREALEKFGQLKASALEKSEKLEQLRALEAGMTIGGKILEHPLIGVDTPEDIKKVEHYLT